MNRPEARNTLSSEMLVRLYDAWVMIDHEPEIRVGILTGAGGTFCSGMDLKAFAAGFDPTEWTERFASDSDLHWKALLAGFQPRKPLIAAVEGYTLAGGAEILQGTDIRVAGEGATFGITEVTRGLFPLGGSTVRLPPADPVHAGGRDAAHRPARPRAGGEGDRAHRARGAGRDRAGHGEGDRRRDRGERAPVGAGRV